MNTSSQPTPKNTENAGLLSKSAVFALRAYACLSVGGLQGGHGKPNLPMGAVCAVCRNAPWMLSAGLLQKKKKHPLDAQWSQHAGDDHCVICQRLWWPLPGTLHW